LTRAGRSCARPPAQASQVHQRRARHAGAVVLLGMPGAAAANGTSHRGSCALQARAPRAPATADPSGASVQLSLLKGDGCAQVARTNSAVTPATAPCAAPWSGGSTCAVAWHARPASDLRVHQLLTGCLARPLTPALLKTGSTAHAKVLVPFSERASELQVRVRV
jgi:hypothetical protein